MYQDMQYVMLQTWLCTEHLHEKFQVCKVYNLKVQSYKI